MRQVRQVLLDPLSVAAAIAIATPAQDEEIAELERRYHGEEFAYALTRYILSNFSLQELTAGMDDGLSLLLHSRSCSVCTGRHEKKRSGVA
jgi:hypothetical protein